MKRHDWLFLLELALLLVLALFFGGMKYLLTGTFTTEDLMVISVISYILSMILVFIIGGSRGR